MEKLCLRTESCCLLELLQGNRGFGDLLNVNFVPKKVDSPREHYTSFTLVTRKYCYIYLLGKLRKHI